MLTFDSPKATAWAPWRRDPAWLLRRDVLACGWLLERAREEDGRVIVQGASHAHHYRDGNGPIARMARLGEVATFRSPVRSGPTIVPDANIRLLATALGAAGGRSVVATESPSFPLLGWAMATGAVNLETGEPTQDSRTDSQVEMIAAFADQLYNGWAHKQVGRRASAYYLPKLAESGLGYDVFVGSLLALDPGHLDSNRDIEEMYKALPAAWSHQRSRLSNAWRS